MQRVSVLERRTGRPGRRPKVSLCGTLGLVLCTTVIATLITPTAASAFRYDVGIRGLGRPDLDPDAQKRFQQLGRELVLVLAPRPMQSAETLGLSGFEFSMGSTLADIRSGQRYWHGQPGSPVLEGVLSGYEVPNKLWVPTLSVRKGLPLSTELGMTASYIAFSQMMMLGAEFKIALHERYFEYFPSFAARIAFSRLVGSADYDIYAGEADGLMSLPFGIAGMMRLTPFVGGGVVTAQIASQIIDETPQAVDFVDASGLVISDQGGGVNGSLYSFDTSPFGDNLMPRAFFGLKLNVSWFELLYELDLSYLRKGGARLMSHTITLGFDV